MFLYLFIYNLILIISVIFCWKKNKFKDWPPFIYPSPCFQCKIFIDFLHSSFSLSFNFTGNLGSISLFCDLNVLLDFDQFLVFQIKLVWLDFFSSWHHYSKLGDQLAINLFNKNECVIAVLKHHHYRELFFVYIFRRTTNEMEYLTLFLSKQVY